MAGFKFSRGLMVNGGPIYDLRVSERAHKSVFLLMKMDGYCIFTADERDMEESLLYVQEGAHKSMEAHCAVKATSLGMEDAWSFRSTRARKSS
jgi:hypothetical protein